MIALPPPPAAEEYDESRSRSSRADDTRMATDASAADCCSATGQETRDEEKIGVSEDGNVFQKSMDIGFKLEDAVHGLTDANGDIVNVAYLLI